MKVLKNKNFDSMYYIEVPPDKVAEVEAHYISRYDPEYNRSRPFIKTI